jgi:acetyl esterase/lipase
MVLGTRYGASEALEVAAAVGGVVASVEYRLAPEHPAPAPGDDCYAGLVWFAEHAAEFGVDPARLLMGGTSAGGGLAAATALRARDAGTPRLAGLLLCCPMLDDRMTTVSSGQFGDDLVWTRASNEFGWGALLGDRAGTADVSIYEAPARADDLSGLPPTLIDVGSADLFRDEDVAFASTIWASGGDAELHVWPGGYHGYELFAPGTALARETHEARRRWLVRTLAKAGA